MRKPDAGMLKLWPCLLLLMATMADAQMHAAMSAPQSGIPLHAGKMVDCPWLTRGTAAAALGGDVSLNLDMMSHSEGTCTFSSQQKPSETLTVTVSNTAPQPCAKKTVGLTGIANRATLCSVSRSRHRHVESVRGLARNTYFTVTLSFRQKKNWRARDAEVEHLADILSGNLY